MVGTAGQSTTPSSWAESRTSRSPPRSPITVVPRSIAIGQREPSGVVGVIADQDDPSRGVGLDRSRVPQTPSAASTGSTGLNHTPLPSSPAATNRGVPGARSSGAKWTWSRAAGQSPPSKGRWWNHSMSGIGAPKRRSRRPTTSTSSVRQPDAADVVERRQIGNGGLRRHQQLVGPGGCHRHPRPPPAGSGRHEAVARARRARARRRCGRRRARPPRPAAPSRRRRSGRGGGRSWRPPRARGSRTRARRPRRGGRRARPNGRPTGRRPDGPGRAERSAKEASWWGV